MSSTVKVIDKGSETVLFTCCVSEMHLAYEQAEKYEDMGLDIELISPSIPETLIRSLGANAEDIDKLNESIAAEIKSHIEEDMGCSLCPPKA
jgi:hypothetical protein